MPDLEAQAEERAKERGERKYGGNVNFTLSEEYAAKLDRIAGIEKRGQSAQAWWFVEEAIDQYERLESADAVADMRGYLNAHIAKLIHEGAIEDSDGVDEDDPGDAHISEYDFAASLQRAIDEVGKDDPPVAGV